MIRPLVEVKGLGKTYPGPLRPLAWLRGEPRVPRRALDEVSFDIRPGEVVGLIGRNGAGKSTLLRILVGLLLPSEGIAHVAGCDVVRDRPRSRREVGAALSEDRGLSPRLSARENLRFFSALFGVAAAESEERIRQLAERLEATRLLDRTVRTLSSGEKARIVLVRALLHRPTVLFLDEITRSLDPGASRRLREQVVSHAAASGQGVLFASHDLLEVESIAQRVLLLDGGRARAFGSFSEVRPEAERVFAQVGA